MKQDILKTSNILLPKTKNMTAWSVVACDQYTSEPSYWNEVEKQTQGFPSTYKLIFPEIYLKTADFDETISKINKNMAEYLADGLFEEFANAYIYVERVLKNGTVRKGIVGVVDLEHYDYSVGSQTAIRATEGTVLDRLPPRVLIREDAPLELPHVLLLIDDEQKSIIEPLEKNKNNFKLAYDFGLMQQSGSIKGYFLPQDEVDRINSKIAQLGEKESFNKRYNINNKDVLLFAVGDGNHSLATAKKCYVNLKEKIGEEKAKQHPARYALVEVGNLHDDSLDFEAIHRVIFDVSPSDVLKQLESYYDISYTPTPNSQSFDVVIGEKIETVYINNPKLNLAVGSSQEFIDDYLTTNSGEIDYIHGEDVVANLCKESDNSIGFILPSMHKNDLFKTVILDGALPRKTFSMGEARDKRFYLEARRIK